MKLYSISVSRYRSISTAKKIKLSESTVLIGPNNEGKSNILRALVLAMSILTRARIYGLSRRHLPYEMHGYGYKWELDFPINLQKSKPNGETELILEFSLEDSEYEEFHEEVKSTITGNLPLRICIGKKGISVTYHKKGRGSKTLSKKSDLIANFVSRRIEFEHIPAVRTAHSAQEIVTDLVSRELSRLEENSDYKDALEKIKKLQDPILEELSSSIHQILKQFLPQVKKVEINLPQSERIRALRRATEIQVDDGTKTPLNYKGDGMQSLAALGIIRYASAKSGRGKNFVIAIEEPESHLHPNAIHELKEVIDDLSIKHQIIITSHNPLFVDRRIIQNNIIVNKSKAKPAGNIQEIRDILGVRASDNLRHAELVLVVEGEDDIISIKALLESQSQYLKDSISNGTLAFDSLAGGSNLSYKISLLRDSICLYHVFIDNDKCGKSSYQKAKLAGLLEDSNINFAISAGKNESELEDLYKLDIYKSVIESKYRILFIMSKFHGKKKWSDRIQEIFTANGKQWNDSIKNEIKYLVANIIASNPNNAINSQDVSIIQALANSLESRLKEKEKARQDISILEV